jgi:phosphoribosyl 1,2-cyclic phosphate phosphodiesterase
MKTPITITFLGTGTSHGVPVVDCMMSDYSICPKGVCKEAENDPKHNRGRSSILVEFEGKSILIDVSSDFREQVLREKVKKIDAVLLTHKHADHITGLPDIRSYSRVVDGALPIYGSSETIDAISQSFSYIFDPKTFVGGGIPELKREIISSPVNIFGVQFIPLPVVHGGCSGCFGYRFGDTAYIPDVKEIPQETMDLLEGVETLIIDTLRIDKPHSTHLILPEAVEIAQKIGAKKVWFTHLCHGIHYKNDKKILNKNMDFAFDGLKLEV